MREDKSIVAPFLQPFPIGISGLPAVAIDLHAYLRYAGLRGWIIENSFTSASCSILCNLFSENKQAKE